MSSNHRGLEDNLNLGLKTKRVIAWRDFNVVLEQTKVSGKSKSFQWTHLWWWSLIWYDDSTTMMMIMALLWWWCCVMVMMMMLRYDDDITGGGAGKKWLFVPVLDSRWWHGNNTFKVREIGVLMRKSWWICNDLMIMVLKWLVKLLDFFVKCSVHWSTMTLKMTIAWL